MRKLEQLLSLFAEIMSSLDGKVFTSNPSCARRSSPGSIPAPPLLPGLYAPRADLRECLTHSDSGGKDTAVLNCPFFEFETKYFIVLSPALFS